MTLASKGNASLESYILACNPYYNSPRFKGNKPSIDKNTIP